MMWSRKKLKKQGKQALRKNWWRIIGISLMLAFIAGGMRISYRIDDAAVRLTGEEIGIPTNAQILNDWYLSIERSSDTESGQILAFLGEHYTPKKGVLAGVYNHMTKERSAFFGFLNAMNDFLFKDKIAEGFVILIGVILLILFLIFVSNVLSVGQCRFLLENRTYRQVKMGRLAFIWRARRWKNVMFIMLKKSVFLFLWDMTIIGGIIKRYSYRMIPFILAENPDIPHREAFLLSRQMMNGNKMRAFILDLSFLGWHILNIFTMDILRYAFITPYTETTSAELYVALREEAFEKGLDGVRFLDDERLYEESDLEEYPVESHRLYNPQMKKWIRIEYERTYSLRSLILIFFTFSFVGWLWEVSLHLFGDGVFVNRGFFHGPWLPIYGTGGILVVVLLKRFVHKPLVTFLMAVVVCGAVEYLSAWLLWEIKGMYWWNYTGYFLNLHGRICAEGLIVFGLGGCAFIYIAAPFFDEIYRRIPQKIARIICVVLLLLFAVDIVYSLIHPNSGAGITDYHVHAGEVLSLLCL